TRALSAHRQAAAVAVATPASDVAQAGDVLLHVAPKRPFHQERAVDDPDDPRQVLFAQLFRAALAVDAELLENLIRVGRADAVDVAEADANRLVRGNIDAGDTGHSVGPLLVVS